MHLRSREHYRRQDLSQLGNKMRRTVACLESYTQGCQQSVQREGDCRREVAQSQSGRGPVTLSIAVLPARATFAGNGLVKRKQNEWRTKLVLEGGSTSVFCRTERRTCAGYVAVDKYEYL